MTTQLAAIAFGVALALAGCEKSKSALPSVGRADGIVKIGRYCYGFQFDVPIPVECPK